MTPTPLNYTPYSFNRSENLHRVNSCELPQPTCVESEPAVLNDEALQLCYVVPMQTCIEEIRRIPGANLFRDAPQLRSRPQNPSQGAPSAPPAGVPGNQGSSRQLPAVSRQNSPQASSNSGGFWSDVQDFFSFSWWDEATTGQRALGVGIAVVTAGGVGALAAAAAVSSAFGAGCACAMDHGDARSDARTDARGDGHSDAVADGHADARGDVPSDGSTDARLDAAAHPDATADTRLDVHPDVHADAPADRPRG